MQPHMMHQCDPFSKLLVTVHTGEPEEMSYFFVLISQRIRPELFGAKIAAEMFFVIQGVPFHVVFSKSIFPLKRQVLVTAVIMGAKEATVLLSHRVVGLGNVVHCLKK